jgi:hypothetical protein
MTLSRKQIFIRFLTIQFLFPMILRGNVSNEWMASKQREVSSIINGSDNGTLY